MTKISKTSVVEISVALTIFAILLPLVWKSSGEVHSASIKIHTYTNCDFAPLLRIYGVPEENKIYGYYYNEPVLIANGCTEFITVSSHPFSTATVRGHTGGNERIDIQTSPASTDVMAHYFKFKKEIRGGMPSFSIQGDFFDSTMKSRLNLDSGVFDIRTGNWDKEVKSFALRSKYRENTRIRIGLSGDYEVGGFEPSPTRIDAKKQKISLHGYQVPTKEYAFELSGRGSVIQLDVEPLNLGASRNRHLLFYSIFLSAALGLLIDAVRRQVAKN